jgi:hypothetical protein
MRIMSDENAHGGTNIHYLEKKLGLQENNSALSKRLDFPAFFFFLSHIPCGTTPLHPQGTKNGQTLCSGPREARWALADLSICRLAGRRLSAGGLSVLPACPTGLKWPACWFRCCYSAVLGDGQTGFSRHSSGGR